MTTPSPLGVPINLFGFYPSIKGTLHPVNTLNRVTSGVTPREKNPDPSLSFPDRKTTYKPLTPNTYE